VTEAPQELARILGSIVLVVDLHGGASFKELRDHRIVLREHEHVARGGAGRHGELKAVAARVEIHGDRGGLHHLLHRIGQRANERGQLLVRRELEADPMEVEQPA
jgi:hypothetical protein